MSVIEDFHAKHGDEWIECGGMLYWPDGAYRENSSYGVLCDGDPDPHKRAKLIRFYWQQRVDSAVKAFDDLKAHLRAMSNAAARDGGFCPDESKLSDLAKLKANVELLRPKLKEAEAQVEATIPAAWKQRAAEKAARQQAGQDFGTRLMGITV